MEPQTRLVRATSAHVRRISPGPMRRTVSEPAVRCTRWSLAGLHVESSSTPLEADAAGTCRLPVVRLQRGRSTARLSFVIERCSAEARTRTVVTVEPAFLRLLVLLALVSSASCYSLGVALPRPAARQQLPSGGGIACVGEACAAGHAAMARLASCTTDECVVALLRGGRRVPHWAEGVAKLVHGDVRRLAGSLHAMHARLCAGAPLGGCSSLDVMLAASLHLDEWARARAPLIHWASARCLGALGVAPAAGLVAPPPSLAECLVPLTREVTPLLATCLVAHPWRLCRLAIRYLAFRASAIISSNSEAWAHKREQLLPKLLEEVNGALDEGWERHVAAARGALHRGASRRARCMRLVASALNGVRGAATFPALKACCTDERGVRVC
ncbi:hypothetical protein AB1Y20_023704 [Prymnesium parvum]|uniref:Uncharacterized protein n=1 Tax=Prymnesium parvum TaxID=97485 RepID=A0AB34JFA8_PRYPA